MMLFMIDGFLEWEIRLFKDYCLWKEVFLLYCKDTPFFDIATDCARYPSGVYPLIERGRMAVRNMALCCLNLLQKTFKDMFQFVGLGINSHDGTVLLN